MLRGSVFGVPTSNGCNYLISKEIFCQPFDSTLAHPLLFKERQIEYEGAAQEDCRYRASIEEASICDI